MNLRKIIISPISLFFGAVDYILRHKRLFIFIVVLFFGIVGISAFCRGGFGPPPRRTDITVYLRAAEAIQNGENIYAVANDRGWFYVYLPLLAILVQPFTHLPLLLNTTLWYALSVSSICGSIILSVKLLQNKATAMRAAVTAMLFCVPTLVEVLTRGQVGAISIFLAMAVLYLYIRGYAVWTGILFAFSVVLKTSPMAFLILFFIVKREWRVVISAFLGMIFFALVFPSLVIGAERNWFFLNEWNRILTHAVSKTGNASHLWNQLATPLAWDNQSIYAVITRWFYPTETSLMAKDNFLIRWGVRASGAIALMILAFVSRRKRSEISRERLMLEYSLFLICMLLFSPVSEIHHYTIFFTIFLPVFLYLNKLPQKSLAYQGLMWGSLAGFLGQICGYIRPLDTWGFPAVGAAIFWCASFIFLACLKKDEEIYPEGQIQK